MFRNHHAGAILSYLAKVKTNFPTVPQPNDISAPKFLGTIDEFLASHGTVQAEFLKQQFQNRVKKCPRCSKPNGFTLDTCNACGEPLQTVGLSHTPNIFTCFMYGLNSFTVSMRYQSKEFLAFDDLLQLTICHMSIIPTNVFIPDWRFLVQKPAEGAALLQAMYDVCWNVFKSQFWENKPFRQKVIKNADRFTSVEDLHPHAIAGLNFPPSQYQLHLQFLMPPFVPFQAAQLQNGVHFTYKRFFPLEYVMAILKLNLPMTIHEDTSIDEVIWYYKQRGVDYDSFYQRCYARIGASHQTLANWQSQDFDACVVNNDTVYGLDSESGHLKVETAQTSAEVVKQIQAQDKHLLQNYGRPYFNNKPSGTYYKFAKEYLDVRRWDLA